MVISVHVGDRHASFHQPAGEQHRPAEPVAAVALLDGHWLPVEGKRLSNFRQYAEATWRELVQPLEDLALATPDPIRKNALLHLAQAAGLMHSLSPEIMALRRDARASEAKGANFEKRLAQLLALSKAFTKTVDFDLRYQKARRS